MIVSVLLDFNVNLHEGEDHVENRVDAREDVPRAAANRHLRDLKNCVKGKFFAKMAYFKSKVLHVSQT